MIGGVCDVPGERCHHPISCEERGCVKRRSSTPTPAPEATMSPEEVARKTHLDRAARVLEEARVKRACHSGECSECVYRRRAYRSKCAHPIVALAVFNATPRAAQYIGECDEQRGTSSIWGPVLCGPFGTLFEQRPPSALRSLIAILKGQS